MGVDMLWRLVLARFTNKTNDGKCQNRLDDNPRGSTPLKHRRHVTPVRQSKGASVRKRTQPECATTRPVTAKSTRTE